MSAILSSTRKILVQFYILFGLILAPLNNSVLSSWTYYWTNNAQKIINLTVINTFITAGSEYVTREVLVNVTPHTKEDQSYKFFVRKDSGIANINRQSLTNILMTFFASLLAGPIFFIRRRSDRFIFFALFGSFNSIISQLLLGVISGGVIALSVQRVVFDFFYNISLKFVMFEWFRKPIVNTKNSNILRLFYLRGKQDVCTTMFKNLILNILRFKG